MSDSFIRARSADQKSSRRDQILDAARSVVTDIGHDAATMADFARQASMSQSAFYRYFKSKEEILAHLLILEATEITHELPGRMVGATDLIEASDCLVAAFSDHPLFCALASDLARTLERNIERDQLVVIKQNFGHLLGQWSTILLEAGVVHDRADAVQFIRGAYVLLAGLWPMTRDRPLVLDAARQAGLSATFGAFQTEFAMLLKNLARGQLS